MIYKINRLRNLLNKQLESKDIEWNEVEKISKKLDLLIIEYYKNKNFIEKDIGKCGKYHQKDNGDYKS